MPEQGNLYYLNYDNINCFKINQGYHLRREKIKIYTFTINTISILIIGRTMANTK
jgi:hypothetical protein